MKPETVAEMIRRLPYRVSHQVTDVWKAMKTAEILLEPYMYRVECCSDFSADAKMN
jgi:hypothetical protein